MTKPSNPSSVVNPMSKYIKDFGKYGIDKVNGFSGTIVAAVLWDRGNMQYSLKPKVSDDGKQTDAFWCDTDFIELGSEIVSIKNRSYDNFIFENGDLVANIKNGFKGFVSGLAIFISGCKQYYLVSMYLEEGKEVGQWVDEQEIKMIKSRKIKTAKNCETSGGPSTIVNCKNI